MPQHAAERRRAGDVADHLDRAPARCPARRSRCCPLRSRAPAPALAYLSSASPAAAMHVAHGGADLRVLDTAPDPPSGNRRAGRRAAGSPAAASARSLVSTGGGTAAPARPARPRRGRSRRGCRRRSGRGRSGRKRPERRTSSACRGRSFLRLYCVGCRDSGLRVPARNSGTRRNPSGIRGNPAARLVAWSRITTGFRRSPGARVPRPRQ